MDGCVFELNQNATEHLMVDGWKYDLAGSSLELIKDHAFRAKRHVQVRCMCVLVEGGGWVGLLFCRAASDCPLLSPFCLYIQTPRRRARRPSSSRAGRARPSTCTPASSTPSSCATCCARWCVRFLCGGSWVAPCFGTIDRFIISSHVQVATAGLHKAKDGKLESLNKFFHTVRADWERQWCMMTRCLVRLVRR